MPTTNTHATTVTRDRDGNTVVTYHTTNIVTIGHGWVKLATGGWDTPTTKRRMNQASEQFNLGYHVYQRDYAWYAADYQGRVHKFDGNTITLPTPA